jgi:hypothetical protein
VQEPAVQSSYLAIPASLISLALSSPANACFAMPDPEYEALVDVGSSSIRKALYVATWAADTGEGDAACRAHMVLSEADVPSRRLVPRPRELAESVAPVASAFGAKTCEITVWLDDSLLAGDTSDPEECQRGTFRYDGGSWSTVEDDAPCW